MDDLISRQGAIDVICKACSIVGDYHKCDGYPETSTWCDELVALRALPSAQPETAKRIVGKSRDGMTLWYQCDMCNEPVDAQDTFCRGCGRRLTNE